MEVIAPDPSAARPSRPRWFDLDNLAADSPPRLAAWVVRIDDIYSARFSCSSILGDILTMSRGHLSWQITVPADGSLPLGGAAPALIEWQVTPHPAGALKDRGCSLTSLEIFHPEPLRVQTVLEAVKLAAPVSLRQLSSGAKPYLVARVKTPRGHCTLSIPQTFPAWGRWLLPGIVDSISNLHEHLPGAAVFLFALQRARIRSDWMLQTIFAKCSLLK